MKNFRKLKIALLFLLCLLIYGIANAAPAATIVTSGKCTEPDITMIPVAAFTPASQPPLDPHTISQGYNNTKKQGYSFKGKRYFGHSGLDLINEDSSPGFNDIKAVTNGYVVASLSTTDSHGWGETIVIATRPNTFSNEIITHQYHHMHKNATGTTRRYNACDVVDGSDVIGKEGKTGFVTGVHLHFGKRRWENLAQLKQAINAKKVGALLGVGYSYGNDNLLARNLDPGGVMYDTFHDYVDTTAPHAWSLPFVLDMRHRGIEFGLFDGRYGAGEKVTRREAARWLKIAAQRTNSVPAIPTFADVDSNDADLPYIEELTHYPSVYPVINIDAHVGPGGKRRFHPDDNINRAEALKMVILNFYSAEFLKAYNSNIWKATVAAADFLLHPFNDVSASDWFAPFVYYGLQIGIVDLGPDAYFHPGRAVKREEMAKWVSQGAAKIAFSISAPCNTIICPADYYCEPVSTMCQAIPTCIPSETVVCPAGGGYDGTDTSDAGTPVPPPVLDSGVVPPPALDSGIDTGVAPLPIFDSGIDSGFVPPPACTDVYLSSSTPSCYTTLGGPTLCLAVQQVSGETWRYQVCKSGGSFLNNYKTVLHDDNHTTQLGDTFFGNPGDTCTPWRNFAVGYIAGYGSVNGAGVRTEVLSPASCVLPACTYSTGTVTIRKECL